jgi:murein DD-endopeptidase MepM/ murein hydrolase activator NlpD
VNSAAARRCATLGVLLTGLILTVPSTAVADPASDKARVDAQLAQTQATLEAATGRAQKAAADLEMATAALPGAQSALADAKGRLAAAEAAQRQADRVADAATDAHQAASDAFGQAAGKVEEARANVGTFVAATYRGGNLLAFNSLLDAGSPSQLARRIGYLDQIAAQQRRGLEALTVARQVARERQLELDRAQQRADDARREAQRAVDESRDATSSAQRAANDVQSLVDQRTQAQATADAERSAVLAQYNELKAQSARIAAELRASKPFRGGTPVARPGPGAFFLMPTPGWKSSDFGMRYDPYYHVWQLHAGVDIAAPTGQEILAAADGQVVHAGWSGGYGNYTCISHGLYQGRNISTCYGHQSRIEVSVGQVVHRGQEIGKVGSTGAATGAHLHFEVRLNGDPVNPLGWLPGCLC